MVQALRLGCARAGVGVWGLRTRIFWKLDVGGWGFGDWDFQGLGLGWEDGYLGNGAEKVVIIRRDTYDTLINSLLRISNGEER